MPAAQRPSRTYRADFAAGRIDGFTDGREAMEQAIYQILHTERFAWPIYSWNYGAELGRLTGRSVRVAQGELPRPPCRRPSPGRPHHRRPGRYRDPVRRKTEEALVHFTAGTVFGDVDAVAPLRLGTV
ncbi:MAG: DUF2634 domain-containing protein [Intestinimonas sp.]